MKMSEEQRKEIEAKLAKMSPEEFKKFTSQQCIFCQIAHGKVPAKTVYEDDKAKAILDINPASPGHCLIFPKDHYLVLPQVPEDLMRHLAILTKKISHALLRALKADGTSWFVANGQVAGQRAQHVIIHVIPRLDNDHIGIFLPQNSLDQSKTQALIKKLSQSAQEPKQISASNQPKKAVPARLVKEEERDETLGEIDGNASHRVLANDEIDESLGEVDGISQGRKADDVIDESVEEIDPNIQGIQASDDLDESLEEIEPKKSRLDSSKTRDQKREKEKREEPKKDSKKTKSSLDDITKFLAGK